MLRGLAELGVEETPLVWYGGVGGLGGYDDDVAAEIDGEVAECRTRLTSRFPSADQRSTVRTKKAVSISLYSYCSQYLETWCTPRADASDSHRSRRLRRCEGHGPNVDFLPSRSVPNNQSYARRRCDWPSILSFGGSCVSSTVPDLMSIMQRTLSPKPHMRARIGCWTTSRLAPKLGQVTFHVSISRSCAHL